jgi:aminomethyltransferase
MTHVQHLTPFLRKTPFHEPIERLMHGQGWVRWMGYQSPAFFDSDQSEYFAIRNGASVYDVSPLIKYAIRGRDAARFVDFLVTRDMTKVRPMQVAYTAWCDDDGRMIEEGTIFRLGENDFLLNAALHQLHWLTEAAYGFDVAIEEVSERFCGLALQGPTSRDVLTAMGVQGIETLPHFGILETKLDGNWLRIDRAGFTGDLGYELWVEPQDALWFWEILFRIGEAHKIAPIGSRALDMARIEAGFILVDVDYIGALQALRPSQRQSPIEAGIGWAVALKKPGYFAGKRALQREKAEGRSRHILIGIEVEGRKPAAGAFLYADRAAKTEIGLTTSALWSPSLKKNIAFARVPPRFAEPGRQMWVEIWYPKEKKIERSMVRCWARNRMFFDPPRKKA